MTDFLIALAHNYGGVHILDKIYHKRYPEQSEEKTNRFDPIFVQTVLFLLNKNDRHDNYIFVVRVPIILRDICTIASDGGCDGGEKIYLMPSKIPIVQHPVIMSHDEVKEFITNAIAKLQSMRISKRPDTPRPRIQKSDYH
jgi:hypothetical protein